VGLSVSLACLFNKRITAPATTKGKSIKGPNTHQMREASWAGAQVGQARLTRENPKSKKSNMKRMDL
jgi:hypothetical protein